MNQVKVGGLLVLGAALGGCGGNSERATPPAPGRDSADSVGRAANSHNAAGQTGGGAGGASSGGAGGVFNVNEENCNLTATCYDGGILPCPKDLGSFVAHCDSGVTISRYRSSCGGTVIEAIQDGGWGVQRWSFSATGALTGTTVRLDISHLCAGLNCEPVGSSVSVLCSTPWVSTPVTGGTGGAGGAGGTGLGGTG